MLLNKSCAELPQVIEHPFHPYHPLTLSDSLDHIRGKIFSCNACRFQYYSSFYYRCELCEFYLHPKCASPILYPMIYMSKLHPHPLAYSDNIPNYNKCSKCGKKFIHAGFRCLQCKFDVHDHCLPLLPPTVKTKWHRHPLTLTHGPIKGDPDESDPDECDGDEGDSVEGDSDEGDRDEGDRDDGEKVDFYCDCCEGKRDLKDPTYYCAKCHLISHVRCVMWEVMEYLQGKSTKVGELCKTKVIVIGEAEATDQDIMDEESDHILIGLRNKIAAASAKLVEYEANREELQKICAATSLKLKGLEERLSERLSQCIAYKIEFK